MTVATKAEKPPLRPGYRRETNRVLEEIRESLDGFSQRRFETRKSMRRVVALQESYFEKPWQIIQRHRRDIIEQLPCPEGWEDSRLPVGLMEARIAAIEEMLDDTQDIPEIPDAELLTEEDLPKLIKGDLGDANQMAVGFLIRRCHFAQKYFVPKKDVADGEDGGERDVETAAGGG
jgi:hypothetical protein